MIKCKLCGREANHAAGGKKIRYGSLCNLCYSRLPMGVRLSSVRFTAAQIRELKKEVAPVTTVPKIWVKCGGFMVGDCFVILNGIKYPLTALESISLNFHPRRIGHATGTAAGIVTVKIVLKKPHILIEEMISDKETEVSYFISGMEIAYNYPEPLSDIIKCVKTAIDNKSCLILEAVRFFRAAETSKKERSDNSSFKGTKQESESKEKTPYEAALELFQIKRPFTKEELRKKRNQYIITRHIHPDDGGDVEEFRKVQAAYSLLSQFAAD